MGTGLPAVKGRSAGDPGMALNQGKLSGRRKKNGSYRRRKEEVDPLTFHELIST